MWNLFGNWDEQLPRDLFHRTFNTLNANNPLRFQHLYNEMCEIKILEHYIFCAQNFIWNNLTSLVIKMPTFLWYWFQFWLCSLILLVGSLLICLMDSLIHFHWYRFLILTEVCQHYLIVYPFTVTFSLFCLGSINFFSQFLFVPNQFIFIDCS